MTQAAASTYHLPRDLGGGLILRRSTSADADRLAEFNANIHLEPPATEPDHGIAAWVRDLLLRPHPTFDPGDFTVVEEQATGKIVSSCNLISQTWTYGGIPFGVGRPELVGTLTEYRKRGLVRAQFDLLHAWSAERGELVQVITGIPHYYRQFGYEMALDLGGGHLCHPFSLPKLKPEQTEAYRLRPATDADAELFVACDAQKGRSSLIGCPRDAAAWRYTISGQSADNIIRLVCYVIETAEGEPAGGLGLSLETTGTRGYLPYLELLPGHSYLAAAPSLLRAAWAEASGILAAKGKTLEALQYGLGIDHPFYRVNAGRLAHVRKAYAWFIRVPDMIAFLRRITPVLEQRLANSAAAYHTGDLLLSFYRSGLKISFERGAIREIAEWPPNDEDAHAAFPGLTFIQLLFGYRSIDDLRTAFPDCIVNLDDGGPLVEALFPPQASRFLPVA